MKRRRSDQKTRSTKARRAQAGRASVHARLRSLLRPTASIDGWAWNPLPLTPGRRSSQAAAAR